MADKLDGPWHPDEKLPEPNSQVEVRTVWSPVWERVVFQGPVSHWWPEKGHYSWFGCFAPPSENNGEIVLLWRYCK